jgi:ABC-type nickel/cobalt efflux system permease component RcnA
LRRVVIMTLAMVALTVVATGAAFAHPLGNATTNAGAYLRITRDGVGIDYVLDIAEIPAVQAAAAIDVSGDGTLDQDEQRQWGRERCAQLAAGLMLSVDDRPSTLATEDIALSQPPGEAGLTTLRLECGLRAAGTRWSGDAGGSRAIRLHDTNDLGRAGWREITAEASGGLRVVDSDVPASSPTNRLRTYAPDQLATPLRVTDARVTVAPGSGGVVAVTTPFGKTGDAVAASFTSLVARQELTVLFAAFAFVAAVALGATHALAPGHGKTVMAGYLVGTHGGPRHAVVLGLTVAASHTAGAWALGVAISASQTLAPERVYPWLGIVSGVLFVAVGVGLLRRSLGPAHHHDHDHDHDGAHAGEHVHEHGPVRWRQIVAPGLAGGLVPSPSAVVVLLGGIALGRAWFGVVLVAAYGLGIAASLVGAGYLLARLGERLRTRDHQRGGAVRRVVTALPRITSALVLVGGLVIAGRGLAGL